MLHFHSFLIFSSFLFLILSSIVYGENSKQYIQKFPSNWQITLKNTDKFEVFKVNVFATKNDNIEQLQIQVEFKGEKFREDKIAYNVYAVPVHLGCENTRMDHYGSFGKKMYRRKQNFMMAKGRAEMEALRNGFNVCLRERYNVDKENSVKISK